jgi:hypothetical protein
MILMGFLVAGGLVFAARWLAAHRPLSPNAAVLPAGYIADLSALKEEYAHYFGQPPDDAKVANRFRSAAALAAKKNYPGVTSMLETASRGGAVPVMFHDLGVAFSLLGDNTRAAESFREALARDPEYAPTRKYLRDYKGIPPGAAEPYTRELEPNNDNMTANLIALRSPVGGEVGAGNDTADYFRIIAPPAPRDLLTIELANHSINFVPRLHVYDSQVRPTSWGESALEKPGQSVQVTGGPAPNSAVYISVTGADTSGQYLLTVTPQKAFDQYEPNDDILSARRITIGEEVPANIMDAQDTDFFSFVSPRKGTVTIEIRNRSTALIPALATYNNDRRNMGFATEIRKAGANVHHTIDVEKDQLYYIQVSSQAGTSGGYTLRVD